MKKTFHLYKADDGDYYIKGVKDTKQVDWSGNTLGFGVCSGRLNEFFDVETDTGELADHVSVTITSKPGDESLPFHLYGMNHSWPDMRLDTVHVSLHEATAKILYKLCGMHKTYHVAVYVHD